MKIAHFFIDRPIFAGVLSIIIVLVGVLAYTQLPVAQFPEIVPPTVVIRATYPGATAQVVADTVATPIEQEINGIEDMLYMSSISTNDGQARITVTFKLGTNFDTAQVVTQNRVAIAQARLPEEARRLGITTQKQSPDLLSPRGRPCRSGEGHCACRTRGPRLQHEQFLQRAHCRCDRHDAAAGIKRSGYGREHPSRA